jgi:hypothetical protein
MAYIERYTNGHDWVWANAFSMCHLNGAIVRYLTQLVPTVCVVQADGFVPEQNLTLALRDQADLDRIAEQYDRVGLLCTRGVSHPKALLLPLDDESFVRGVWDTVSGQIQRIPWEEKKPIAYWRGCLSGGKAPTLRTRVVWELHDFEHADAKLTRNVNMDHEHQGRMIFSEDTRFYDESRSLQDHVQHKYILILDGNCIASALQWVFASGSVPILVTHPDNDWWFKGLLVDGVQYVSVKYDLSNLRDVIQYLVEHDDYARDVANHAMLFARTELSAEAQREYLLTRTGRRASGDGNGECGDGDGDHQEQLRPP